MDNHPWAIYHDLPLGVRTRDGKQMIRPRRSKRHGGGALAVVCRVQLPRLVPAMERRQRYAAAWT